MTGLAVHFTYGSQQWYFRRPQLGNQDEIAFTRVNRRTRGGDLIIFRDAEWPKTEVQNIKFDFNTEAELRTMLNFLHATLGTIIQYTDHENKVWNGFIQNPDAQAICTGLNHYTIALKFEGDLG